MFKSNPPLKGFTYDLRINDGIEDSRLKTTVLCIFSTVLSSAAVKSPTDLSSLHLLQVLIEHGSFPLSILPPQTNFHPFNLPHISRVILAYFVKEKSSVNLS